MDEGGAERGATRHPRRPPHSTGNASSGDRRLIRRTEFIFWFMPRNKRSSRKPRAAEEKLISSSPAGDSKKSTRPPVSVKWHPAYALIPVALALLTSINSLENGFAYDDQNQVLNNEFIRDINNLPLAFTSSVWAFLNHSVWNSDNYFRPLFINLCTINYAIFGTTAWGWHLMNVLIHAGVTYFVFIICKELTSRH